MTNGSTQLWAICLRLSSSSRRGRGNEVASRQPGEDTLAAGAFSNPGDAQASHLVARGLTSGNVPISLSLADEASLLIAEGSTVAYRVLVAARGTGGNTQAAYEAQGLARRDESGAVSLLGPRVSPIHESDPALNFEVIGDTQRGALGLSATGAPGTQIRWVALVELVEVRF